MLRRIADFIPTYRDTRDHTGNIISSVYLAHVPVHAVVFYAEEVNSEARRR